MKKTVMILGAGLGQLPFIDICKKNGYRVIVVSRNGNYPGFEIADTCYYIDTRDKEQIAEIAKHEKIDAILSDQTDVSVPSVAYVSEQMGLKTIGYDKAISFSNKYIMRQKAREIGINVPNFFEAKSREEAVQKLSMLTFPVIMKPVDSSGSRGVVKANTAKDVEHHFHNTCAYSKNGSIIIEEFIEGVEYLVNGLALEGKYINTDLGVKEYFDKPGYFISKMCMFISAEAITKQNELDVLSVNKKLVQGLQLPFGITHGEYIVSNKDGKVYLVEIAARGGGVYLSSHLTPLTSGINVNQILIDYVVEDNIINLNQLHFKKNVAAWICFALNKGTIIKIINKDKLYKMDGICKVCLDNIKIGVSVETLTDDSNKYGPILVEAKSREECDNIISNVRNTFDIIVKDNNGNISHIIW